MDTVLEIERKYLVRGADLRDIESLQLYHIESIYLDVNKLAKSDPEVIFSTADTSHELRVSKITDMDGNTDYTSVSKVGDYDLVREELALSIDESAFNEAVENFGKSKLEKKRFMFTYNNTLFSLDIFNDGDPMILEVELESERQLFEVPPFIDIIRDVTGESDYYSANLSTPFEDNN